jgi:CRISPR/Cas system CMR-associated protein Cmr1 (group 7 of RAMP superfamily)
LDKNQPDKIQSTHFFSPAYMQLGTGLAYAKGDSFQLQWNPINARVIVVDADFTKDLAAGETYFGVAAGKSSRWEAGVSVSMESNIEVATNILLRNKLNVVTNYLEEFKNVDFDYTLTSQMKVNKHVSALFELQLIYDDNAIADLQVRQIFGLSIALPY